jgi:branched-chain amino acid transport system substrate-binding protein
MKRKSLLPFLLIGLAIATAIAIVLLQPRTVSVIQYGAILPLSGDGASYGKSTQRGIDLFLESQKFKDLKLNTKVVYEDSQLSAKNAVSAWNKLVTTDKVSAVLGPFTSSEMLALAPLAEKQKVPLISHTATSPEITKAGDYSFRIIPSDIFDGRAVAHMIKKSLGNGGTNSPIPVSIVYINNDYGKGVKDVFEKEAPTVGLKVTQSQAFAAGTNDFRSILTELQNQKATNVFLIGTKEMGRFLKQMVELNQKYQIFSTGLMEDPEVIKQAQVGAEGVIYSYPSFNPESSDETVKSFVTSFQAKYQDKPDVIAALGYDLAAVVAQAQAKAKDLTPESIKAALYTTKEFSGVTGTISIDENGDVIKGIGIKQVKNGKFGWVTERLIFQ